MEKESNHVNEMLTWFYIENILSTSYYPVGAEGKVLLEQIHSLIVSIQSF